MPDEMIEEELAPVEGDVATAAATAPVAAAADKDKGGDKK